MHAESLRHMKLAFRKHLGPMGPGSVLEVGSKSQRQEYRRIFETKGWKFTGVDLDDGKNVDCVLEDPFRFPFEDNSFDCIISGQMLEHNTMFWLTFMEMARVTRMGGVMVHIAPSRGPEHRAPTDCWRFYRDGMNALGEWCGMEMLQSSTDWSRADIAWRAQSHPRSAKKMEAEAIMLDTGWGDTVGVFRKVLPTTASVGAGYIRRFAVMYQDAPAMQIAAE